MKIIKIMIACVLIMQSNIDMDLW